MIDTGASLSVVPNQEYFEFPVTSSTFTQMSVLASQTPVMGIGQVKWV